MLIRTYPAVQRDTRGLGIRFDHCIMPKLLSSCFINKLRVAWLRSYQLPLQEAAGCLIKEAQQGSKTPTFHLCSLTLLAYMASRAQHVAPLDEQPLIICPFNN